MVSRTVLVIHLLPVRACSQSPHGHFGCSSQVSGYEANCLAQKVFPRNSVPAIPTPEYPQSPCHHGSLSPLAQDENKNLPLIRTNPILSDHHRSHSEPGRGESRNPR